MNTRSKGSTPNKIALSSTKNVLKVNQTLLNTADSTKQTSCQEKGLGKRMLQSFSTEPALESIALSVSSRKRDLKFRGKDKENL